MLAWIVGAAVAAATWAITNAMAHPDEVSAARQVGESITSYGGGARRFVWYMTGFFGSGAFLITILVSTRLANRKWERERVPPAKQVR